MSKSIFLNSNDRLFMKVRPFTGKYAAKKDSIFQEIAEIQSKKMKNNWTYRPINSEIEITNCCNQACPHCGMSANGMKGVKYNNEELSNYINQLYDNGIISFSVTGGEPFLEFTNMINMFKNATGRVDICKITSNGFWGNKAENYFSKMVSAGLLKNRFLVPCLMISIGEQSTPMDDTCKIFYYAIKNFAPNELTLCISSLSEYGKNSKVQLFVETYTRNYGSLPEDRIFLTENYYRNSICMKKSAKDVSGRNVATYMSGPVRCFEQTIGKYILPRIFVKASGEICTCACFNPPEQLYIGNIRNESLSTILQKINDNPYVKIIAEDGLHNFRHWIDIEKCKNISCNNECEACKYLIQEYEKIKLLRLLKI